MRSSAENREVAKNSESPFAVSKSLSDNDVTSKPRNSEGNQQGSLSAKDERLARLFEDDVTVRFAKRTADHYLADARLFLGWLASRRVALKDVRPEDVHRYQGELYAAHKPDGHPYAAATIMLRLMAVKTLFRFLVRRGLMLFDPSSSIELPRTEKKLPRVILSEREAKRIVTAPRGRDPLSLRDRAMLETLYGTGIRVNELVELKPADIDTEDRVLRVVSGKGRKDRNVPLTAAAARAIERYLDRGPPRAAWSPWWPLARGIALALPRQPTGEEAPPRRGR